jgi:hypothetical protein
VPQAELLILHKSNENLVAISMAIKAVNANYKEGENG